MISKLRNISIGSSKLVISFKPIEVGRYLKKKKHSLNGVAEQKVLAINHRLVKRFYHIRKITPIYLYKNIHYNTL